MSAREQEVIAKFYQLDRDAQQRVREVISQEADITAFDYEAWNNAVERLRQEIHASQSGRLPPIDVVRILREIRDGEDE
jgi:hypothetical protein